MLGLSIEGPGSLTAEPVPEDITRYPALLIQEVRKRELQYERL